MQVIGKPRSAYHQPCNGQEAIQSIQAASFHFSNVKIYINLCLLFLVFFFLFCFLARVLPAASFGIFVIGQRWNPKAWDLPQRVQDQPLPGGTPRCRFQ